MRFQFARMPGEKGGGNHFRCVADGLGMFLVTGADGKSIQLAPDRVTPMWLAKAND
jgi:hypothetical protein